MPTRNILIYGLYKRGSVLCIPDFKFTTGEVRRKYCILMEDFEKERKTVIIILTTTNLKYKNKKWTVFIPTSPSEEFPKEDTLIDCNNWFALPKDKILEKKCKFVCSLKKETIDKINKSLEFAFKIPPGVMLRIKPNL